MARKKTNQIPAMSRAINVRVGSLLEHEIKSVCKKHDLPISHFGRKAFSAYLLQIRNKSSLFDEVSQ